MWRNLSVLLVAAGVVALPFVFRQQEPAGDWRPGDPALVIVSPHNEAIRYEFAHAFSDWYREKHGRPVKIDWLNIGGATEISRYLVSEFAASGKTTTRVDLFFGGGEYDHTRLAQQGLMEEPWPGGALPVDPGYPERLSGETWRTATMFGTALSTFGICYNADRLHDLGVTNPPTHWSDLADPRYFGQVAVSDPSKSGSIAKAFEMIIHQQCRLAVARVGFTDEQITTLERQPTPEYDAAIAQGWRDGLRLVQLIGANARYFTDSASKVALDVSAGDAAAGISIDFYARFQAEISGHMMYVTPVGGSSVSADPVGLLKGAPNRNVAVRFIEFVLSDRGQSLWNSPVGKKCSTTKKYALRRFPIRQDFYPRPPGWYCTTDAFGDPTVNPYELAKAFTYRPRWTARHFNAQRDLIRAMCLDSGDELRAAWQAIVAGGGPSRQAAAMELLQQMPVTWASVLTITKQQDRLTYLREWTEFYRQNYRRAREAVRP